LLELTNDVTTLLQLTNDVTTLLQLANDVKTLLQLTNDVTTLLQLTNDVTTQVLLVLVSGMKLYPYQSPGFLLLTLPTLEQTVQHYTYILLQKFSLLSNIYFTNQRSIHF
jgi:hypothetical protein